MKRLQWKGSRMRFYLVRHGQTDWNNEKRFQGHRNIPMNEAGIQQVNDLADRIANEEICFDTMIASPLDRAKKTAEIIAEKTGFKKEIVFDEDFVERDCGALEGEVWHSDLDLEDPKYRMETIPEMCDRAKRALDKYHFAEDETIMIVAHGAILMAVRTVLSDYKIDYYDRNDPVIQGNILCCEKEEGKDPVFFNVF